MDKYTPVFLILLGWVMIIDSKLSYMLLGEHLVVYIETLVAVVVYTLGLIFALVKIFS